MPEPDFPRPEETPSFIGVYKIDNVVCDSLIDFFEMHPELHSAGEIDGGVDTYAKDSTDLSLEMHEPVFQEYMDHI